MFAMPGARAFSLAAERASSAVSCGVTGAFVGDVPLLQAVGTGATRQWVVRAIPELNEDLSTQYGLPIDVAAKAASLALIATAFNRGDLAMAAIATVQMQFPDPPLTTGREADEDIGRRALELHRSRLLKFWDPAKHPRTGAPPNPGWFAPESDRTEAIPVIPVAERRPPWFWPWGKKPAAPGGGAGPPGGAELPFPGGGIPRLLPPAPAPAPARPAAPQGARPTWSPSDPKSKLPFMSQSEPQLAPYEPGGKTSGIFRAPGMTPIELQSGYDGPTAAIPKGTPGFDGNVRSHVEAQAAAIMRLYGISEASVEINNPEICDQCNNQLKSMVPPGGVLYVILPNGQRVPFKGERR